MIVENGRKYLFCKRWKLFGKFFLLVYMKLNMILRELYVGCSWSYIFKIVCYEKDIKVKISLIYRRKIRIFYFLGGLFYIKCFF